jgi:hypothetical protein
MPQPGHETRMRVLLDRQRREPAVHAEIDEEDPAARELLISRGVGSACRGASVVVGKLYSLEPRLPVERIIYAGALAALTEKEPRACRHVE